MLVILIVPQRETPSIRFTSINDGESGWDIIYRLRLLIRARVWAPTVASPLAPIRSLRFVLRAPFLGARYARPSLCCFSLYRGSLRSPLRLATLAGWASLAATLASSRVHIPCAIVATRVRLCRDSPTHPRSPLATRGGSRYSLRLVATARALAPIEAFWWGLLRLPSLNLFGGGVLPCRGRFVVSLAFFRLSLLLASYVRAALVGLLRLVCCQARHNPLVPRGER